MKSILIPICLFYFPIVVSASFLNIPGCPSIHDSLPKLERNETVAPCFCDNATADADPPVAINCLVDPTFDDLSRAMTNVKKTGKRLYSVYTEYMRFNDSQGIPDNYFEQFGLLPTEITILGCLNDQLPLNYTFSGLENILKNLSIIGCTLLTMPRSIANLASLESLTLKDTFIQEIHHGDLGGLKSLKYLNLVGNEIYYVEDGAFDDLGKVETAILGPRNSMNSSVLTELNQLVSVETLYLYKNNIEILPDNALSSLRNLQTLDLTSNSIENITAGSLAGLTNLTTLLIPQNQLKRIDDGAFKHLHNLLELGLEANYIEDLRPEIFTGLDSLQRLGVDWNEFYTIDKGVFANTPHIQYMNLRKELNLQYIHPDAFSGLKDLKLLNLSLSNITTIDPNLLKPIGMKLEVLDLAGSNLSHLSVESFHYGAHIQNLSLSGTNLTGLPDGVFSYLTHLKYLDLSNIKWICDDKLAWLVRWLKNQMTNNNLTLINRTDTSCWEPLELRYTLLTTFDPSILKPYAPLVQLTQPAVSPATTRTPHEFSNDTNNSSIWNNEFSQADNGSSNGLSTETPNKPITEDAKMNGGLNNDEGRKVKIIIAIVASVVSAATIAVIIIVVTTMRKSRRKREQQNQQTNTVTQELGTNNKPIEETELTITQLNGTNGSVTNGNVRKQRENGRVDNVDHVTNLNDEESKKIKVETHPVKPPDNEESKKPVDDSSRRGENSSE